jgi:hypothetical protein
MNKYALARIEAFQQELEQLRKVLSSEMAKRRRKTRLRGLWKGVEVTEEEIEEAKRALFKGAYR